ncbi:hypothetical protein D9M68_380300 [compost metagenome]
MAKLFSALRPPVAVLRQASGWVKRWPLPMWVTTSVSGRFSGRPKPLLVCVRSRLFIDTVSPARSSVRSKMVWAMPSGRTSRLVGTLKRQGSIPRCQSLQVKARSSTPLSSLARALTNQALVSYSFGPLQLGASGDTPLSITMPLASVVPVATALPSQLDTRTSAPATTLPLSSVVTQAIEFSRPSLKCTARLVASAVVRTYIVRPAL